MFDRVKEVIGWTTTNAGTFGWKWRFMTSVSCGILIGVMWGFELVASPEKFADFPQDEFKAVGALIAVIMLLLGEYRLLAHQDEFFKGVEIRAIATGGLFSFLAVIWFYLTGISFDDTALLGEKTITLMIMTYSLVRTAYSIAAEATLDDEGDD